MTQYPIRRATIDDLETLVELRTAMQGEVGDPTEEELRAFTEATWRYLSRALVTGDFLAWIAEAEGRIVATSGLVFFHRPPTFDNLAGREAYVMNMYTRPEWRGRGIAADLLSELIAYVKTTGTRRIWLHARKQARPIYSRAGFTDTHNDMELRFSLSPEGTLPPA